jgi:hypothetical protein
MSGMTMEMLSVRLRLYAGDAVLYANGMKSILYPSSSGCQRSDVVGSSIAPWELPYRSVSPIRINTFSFLCVAIDSPGIIRGKIILILLQYIKNQFNV